MHLNCFHLLFLTQFAKFLTFVYAVVMTSVVVGVAVQVASDFSSGDSPVPVEANTTTTTTENPNCKLMNNLIR